MSEHVPEGWESTVLGELGEFSTSGVDKKLNSSEIPVRLINYMDVYRNCYLASSMNLMSVTATRAEVEKSQVRSGDIFFTPSSETPDDIGHSAVLVDDAPGTLHSYHTVRLRIHPSRNVDNRFRGRLANTKSVLKHFSISATGSTRYTLSLGDFRSAPVNLPPIKEQTKIAQVLDTLDTAIARTEALIAKLKAVKQGLLHDLLTRGIDANGELRPPQSEAPQLYKQSALGWVPREWGVRKVADISVVKTGRTPPGSDPGAWGTAIPFITPGDIPGDQRLTESERYISERGTKYVQILPARSVVIVCIGSTIGKVGITTAVSCTNQQINAVIPNDDIDPDFLFLAMSMHASQMRGMAGLQAVPIVKKSAFETIEIPIPSLVEQQAIASRVMCLDARIEGEMGALTKLKDEKIGLMDDLLTGRVRVTALVE